MMCRFYLSAGLPSSGATIVIYNGHSGLGGQGMFVDHASKALWALSGGIAALQMSPNNSVGTGGGVGVWHSCAIRINGSQLWESWWNYPGNSSPSYASNLGYNGTNTPVSNFYIMGMPATSQGISNGYLADAAFLTTQLCNAQLSNYVDGGAVFM